MGIGFDGDGEDSIPHGQAVGDLAIDGRNEDAKDVRGFGRIGDVESFNGGEKRVHEQQALGGGIVGGDLGGAAVKHAGCETTDFIQFEILPDKGRRAQRAGQKL